MQGMGPQGPMGMGVQPGYGAPPMGNPSGSGSGDYEFNETENASFGDLASKMRFVGLMGVIFGVLAMVLGIAGLLTGGASSVGTLIQGLVSFLVGIWTRTAAGGFQRVVDTQGNDIANLMSAVGELRRIYGLQRVLLIIALVFIALAFMLGILFMVRATPHVH